MKFVRSLVCGFTPQQVRRSPWHFFFNFQVFVFYSPVVTTQPLLPDIFISLRRNRRYILLLLERLPVLLLVAGRLLCEPASYTLPPSPAKSGFYLLVFQGRTIGVVILSLDVTFPVARAILLCMYSRFGLVQPPPSLATFLRSVCSGWCIEERRRYDLVQVQIDRY